jgi:flagellar protein FliL
MSADQAGETKDQDLVGSAPGDVVLDTSAPPRSAQKVDLDLDDAPFLEEEEEVQPEPVADKPSASFEADKTEKPAGKFDKKKLILIGAGALVLLVALGISAKLFLFKSKGEPAPPKQEHSAPKEPAPVENATEVKPEIPEIQVKLEPFWVEQKDGKEEIRFLIVRMLLGTQDQAVAKELETKLLPTRNAIFYYLKNKDVQFLSDERNAEKMKTELLMVINQYISAGKFDTLMFEEYVVK